MDFLLAFDGEQYDLCVGGTAFSKHEGLQTAICLSLGLHRGEWWGDALGEPGDFYGSRLHELARQPLDPTRTPVEARDIVLEALEWAFEDGVASQIDVEVEVVMPDRLNIALVVHEPAGDVQRFAYVWEAGRGLAV